MMVAKAVAVCPIWIERLAGRVAEKSGLVPAGTEKRPILLLPLSVNQSAPSGPVTRLFGTLLAGSGNWVETLLVLMRPSWLLPEAANHSAPSGPVVMLGGRSLVGNENSSVIVPSVMIRPILEALSSANHSAPSGPRVMPKIVSPVVERLNPWIVTGTAVGSSCTTLPNALLFCTADHSLPSGSEMIPVGLTPKVFGMLNSLMEAFARDLNAILFVKRSANHSAPSAPTVMPKGWLPTLGTANSVMTPAVVI